MVDKRADLLEYKTALKKMLPKFYRMCLQSQLNSSQSHTLEILAWLLQFQKQVRIERLAACLYQSCLKAAVAIYKDF